MTCKGHPFRHPPSLFQSFGSASHPCAKAVAPKRQRRRTGNLNKRSPALFKKFMRTSVAAPRDALIARGRGVW
jgi:hypothetical protein